MSCESIQHHQCDHAELQQIGPSGNVGQGCSAASRATMARPSAIRQSLETSFKLRDVSDRLDSNTQRFENPQGLLPRLMTDRWSADNVSTTWCEARFELHSILYRSTTGQGTLGKLVNGKS